MSWMSEFDENEDQSWDGFSAQWAEIERRAAERHEAQMEAYDRAAKLMVAIPYLLSNCRTGDEAAIRLQLQIILDLHPETLPPDIFTRVEDVARSYLTGELNHNIGIDLDCASIRSGLKRGNPVAAAVVRQLITAPGEAGARLYLQTLQEHTPFLKGLHFDSFAQGLRDKQVTRN